MTDVRVELGLGLIGIGRPWGHVNAVVPDEADAMRLLDRALDLGVRWFDTAPSYGLSEERFGKFLRGLTAAELSGLTIATKFGEQWDAERGEPYVDHSFDGLRRSLDRSRDLLGRVDVLQLHKTTPEVLRSEDLARAWEYALAAGVRAIGPSVSDPVSAEIARADTRYSVMQLPFNSGDRRFEDVLHHARPGLRLLLNRPFAMGALLYGDAPVDKRAAFVFVVERLHDGVVLTGTKSAEHLADNIRAFEAALRDRTAARSEPSR